MNELEQLAEQLEATHKDITKALLATGEHSSKVIDEARIAATLAALQRVATNTAIRTLDEAADEVNIRIEQIPVGEFESGYSHAGVDIRDMLQAKAAALQNASPTKEN